MTAYKPSFRLDVDQPKRNVFVTQLNDREDEEEDVKAFPIVKENAAQLIEQGINTLQRTLLLKKEVEVEKVDDELSAKREEFRRRMESCAERQIDIQKKQQKMRDRVSKFEKFIKENDAKRRRAIQKYQNEVKLKEQKSQEHELLLAQLEQLKARQEYLRAKLAMYKIYEDYLNRVVEVLPAHYLEVNDSMLSSLMMRHRTLSDTNNGLVDKLETMTDQVEEHKQELKDTQVQHDKHKFSINSQLSILKKQQETRADHNEETEQKFEMEREELRNHRTELGMILMGIDNLAEKCRRRLDSPLDQMDLEMKLTVVQECLNDRADVHKLVQRGMISSAQSKERTRPQQK